MEQEASELTHGRFTNEWLRADLNADSPRRAPRVVNNSRNGNWSPRFP
jgi:hypothetical protein